MKREDAVWILEKKVKHQDVSLDAHQFEQHECEDLLFTCLDYVTSCEEESSAREEALKDRAAKLEESEVALLWRTTQLQDHDNQQIAQKHSGLAS